MDLVHDGIAGRDGKSRDSPGPTPAAVIAAEPPEEEHAENKVFGKVGALANEMVNHAELMVSQMREEPAHDGQEHRCGVFGGEGVSRKSEDDASPDQGRPPRAKPGGN